MAVLDTLDTLAPIREKVEAGERLDFEDGLALMETDDLLALGELADLARRVRGGGDEVYFVQNLYLNQTNVCRVKCKFCAFAKTQKQEDSYTISADELVEDAVAQHELAKFTEIHCVNGENPHVDLEFYADVLRKLKAALPDVHLKFYTASEIHHMSKLEGCSHEEVLRVLKDAGLGSLPGGGAEIFAPRVRAADRARQGAGGGVVPRPRHRAPDGHPDALHAALRSRRDVRGARRPHAPAARAAGCDRRLPRLHPARVPSGEHGLRAARLQVHDGRGRPEDGRRCRGCCSTTSRTSRRTGS